MRKSVGLLIAGVLFITMMYTGTVCYGAELSANGAAAEERCGNGARSVNTQTGSTTKICKLVCGGHDVYITVSMSYSWDEGYTGWFTGWAVSQYSCKEAAVSSPSVKVNMEGGTITFTFNLTVNDVGYTGSATYTVNEYGEVL